MTADENASCGNCAACRSWTISEYEPGFVSIIIPCYNYEKYVGEAIRSALDQTYAHKEVIVVDDGSTDRSLDVIRSFGSAVRWETGPNRGGPAARNRGLRLARGEYVQFHDADDILTKDAVGRRMDAFSPDVDVVFGDLMKMDERGRRAWRWSSDKWNQSDPLEFLIRRNISTPAPLHKHHWLERVGGFDESLPHGQEWDLHIRLFLAGARFRYCPGTVCYARDHPSLSRVSKKLWYDTDPRYRLRKVAQVSKAIRESSCGGVSNGVRLVLARGLVQTGRLLARKGLADVAEEYLAAAEAMSPDGKHPTGKTWRVLRRLLGTTAAEKLCLWNHGGFRRMMRELRKLLGAKVVR